MTWNYPFAWRQFGSKVSGRLNGHLALTAISTDMGCGFLQNMHASVFYSTHDCTGMQAQSACLHTGLVWTQPNAHMLINTHIRTHARMRTRTHTIHHTHTLSQWARHQILQMRFAEPTTLHADEVRWTYNSSCRWGSLNLQQFTECRKAIWIHDWN